MELARTEIWCYFSAPSTQVRTHSSGGTTVKKCLEDAGPLPPPLLCPETVLLYPPSADLPSGTDTLGRSEVFRDQLALEASL
jgi:hypothetical protein